MRQVVGGGRGMGSNGADFHGVEGGKQTDF